MSSGLLMILYTLVAQTDENIKQHYQRFKDNKYSQAHEFQVCHAPKQQILS